MLTKGAVEDLIFEHLSGNRKGAGAAPAKAVVQAKRTFLSDWELRRMYRPGAKVIRVPAGAIISPLALDWIEFNGIEILEK
ncbi:MAG: hypothetical protein ACYC2I_08315 [Elusimicrobiales bacterium]